MLQSHTFVQAPIHKSIIIDATNNFTESVDDILTNLSRISGANDYKYTQPSNPFEEAVAVTSRIRPTLATSLLGWHIRKPGLVDGLETYFAAYKAFL